jgi:flagellar protein FliS
MIMNSSAAIQTYKKVGIESGVNAADPHKLIAMLFQGVLLAIANAKNAILRKDIPAKSIAISKSLAILDEGLDACLDKEEGGQLAENLSQLYQYMEHRLVVANINNDMTVLDEVASLLSELSDAWDAIRPDALKIAEKSKSN